MGSKWETIKYIAGRRNDSHLGIVKVDLYQESPIVLKKATREDLAVMFSKLGFLAGAEIGVAEGLFSECLCKCNPRMMLYSVDAWKPYKGYRDRTKKLAIAYEEAKKRLAPYNCELIRKFSIDAAKQFDDGSLDFVYIDGNHNFQQVVADIAAWSKKVKSGGIISGHDFNHIPRYTCHAKNAVEGWTSAYEIDPWFILKGDWRTPSWFWIKE